MLMYYSVDDLTNSLLFKELRFSSPCSHKPVSVPSPVHMDPVAVISPCF